MKTNMGFKKQMSELAYVLAMEVFMGKVDLHVHTTFSDGNLSPWEVVEKGYNKKLQALGITDHDTMQGISGAQTAGRKFGIEIIPGFEFSTDYEGNELHILGYYCKQDNINLIEMLNTVKSSRFDRMVAMVEKIKKLGLKIDLSDILNTVKGDIFGRPHLAAVLCQKGYCKSSREAFERYIGKGCPAYVERFKVNTFEGIDMIVRAGGIPVLAHPGIYGADEMIPSLKNGGLSGIEVFHPDHDLDAIFRYKKIASDYNLIITGGSDFHGEEIGSASQLGNVTVGYSCVEKMKSIQKTLQ